MLRRPLVPAAYTVCLGNGVGDAPGPRRGVSSIPEARKVRELREVYQPGTVLVDAIYLSIDHVMRVRRQARRSG